MFLLLRQKEESLKIELEIGSQKRGLGNPSFQRNKDSLTYHECLARQKVFQAKKLNTMRSIFEPFFYTQRIIQTSRGEFSLLLW